MPTSSSPSAPQPPSRRRVGPSRARTVLVVLAIGVATLAGLLLDGWVSAVLLGAVVLALSALTLGTWHQLTVPGRGLRVIVLGLLAATAVARLPL